jgi:hypothetical protein
MVTNNLTPEIIVYNESHYKTSYYSHDQSTKIVAEAKSRYSLYHNYDDECHHMFVSQEKEIVYVFQVNYFRGLNNFFLRSTVSGTLL